MNSSKSLEEETKKKKDENFFENSKQIESKSEKYSREILVREKRM